MKSIIFVVLVIVPLIAGNLLNDEFDAFCMKHGRNYKGMEYEKRLRIYSENLKIAEAHQQLDATAYHGPTKFFDMTYEEWKAQYLMGETLPQDALAPNCLKHGIYNPSKPNSFRIPDNFDWRNQDYVVTPVKDQGNCGSCWAFSTVANIEGVLAVNGDPKGDLSPQWVVDCSHACTSEIYQGDNITVCNEGCNGGWPWAAYYDIINQGGLVTQADYPYKGVAGQCKQFPDSKKIKIKSYTCITPEYDALDENVLAQSLMQYGPLSIAVNANYFFSYNGGIMDITACSQTQYLNHAILLVGFGVENNIPYWIIKNSWGPSWGEKGFIRMVRNKNMCGITYGVVTADV